MKFFKKYKKLIVMILLTTIILIGSMFAFKMLNNENALTVEERNWIDQNIDTVMNVNIVNDSNVFGKEGEGVFYDFLEGFESKYNIKLNKITYPYAEGKEELSLAIASDYSENDLVLFEDHYVVLSKNNEVIYDLTDLNNYKISVLESDLEIVKNSFLSTKVEFNKFDDFEELVESEDTEYLILPRLLYLDYILENDYNVIAHISDASYYYILKCDGSMLSGILKKYYNREFISTIDESIKFNEFTTYVESLKITDSEIANLIGHVYTYGFLINSPYEVMKSDDFGGIAAVVLEEFSNFSGVEIEYEKFKTYDSFASSIKKAETNIYLNKYSLSSGYNNTTTGLIFEYVIVANQNDDTIIKSINSLSGKIVYVQSNTKIASLVSEIADVNLKTYQNEEDLFKLNKDNAIIVLDKESFTYYNKSHLTNYNVRYSNTMNSDLPFAISTDDSLYLLFNKYINLMDENSIVIEGLENHQKTIFINYIISIVTRYILLAMLVMVVITYLIIKKTKKIQIAKKVKREDKLKFIDQLTSLKNRNYLNECLEMWNNNTVYPQTVILVDLNGIQKINDKLGYNEGDRQIKAFANALIKTQLDNSEIMRTDGNEFVIYLIGYNQKQIVNYIHKLTKEVDKLPYDNGAKFGYESIHDNLKSVEDALNDASNDMIKKNQNEEEKL